MSLIGVEYANQIKIFSSYSAGPDISHADTLRVRDGPLTQIAKQSAFTDKTIIGNPYRHRVLAGEGHGRYIHIYLADAGRPWVVGAPVAVDPSPQNLIMLKMLSLESAPRLYVGRPCYHWVKYALCDFTVDRYTIFS